MMSTAILMMAGVEQTSVRPVSADQSEPEGASFAKSLGERVGHAVMLQGENPSGEAAATSQGLKSTALAKRPDESPGVLTSVKVEAVQEQETPSRGELKNALAEKIVPQYAAAAAGSQATAASEGSGITKVEPTAREPEVTGGDPPVLAVARTVPEVDATTESLAPTTVAVDEGWTPTGSVDAPAVQKETKIAEKMQELGSTKKTTKAQGRAATPKIVQKTIGADASTVAIETRSILGRPTVSGTPVVGQAVANAVNQRNEIGIATEDLSKTFLNVAKPVTGGAPAIAGNPVRKEPAHEAKASPVDIETTVTAADESIAMPKTGTNSEKMSAGTAPAGNGNGSQIQGVPGPVVMVHATSVGGGGSPITALAIGPSDAHGIFVASKPPAIDASAHVAGLPAELKEQDGSGIVPTSIDGVPRILSTTPTSLEVGIQNGTHGWLKVRAEMTDNGGVNASVSAASSAGQEMLHRELPSLTAYLQEQKVAVNAIVVHAPLAAGAESRGPATGMDGGGQTSQKNNEEGQQQRNVRGPNSNVMSGAMTYRSLNGFDEDGSLPLAAFVSGGSWLSVRA